MAFLKPLLLTAVLFVSAAALTHAQAPADGGPAPTTPTGVPIDGGASLLLASGVAYGLRRLRRRRKTAR